MRRKETAASAVAPESALVRLLAEAASGEEAVPRLLEVMATSFGWAAGELWLAEDRGDLLRYAGDWSSDEPDLVAFRMLGRRLAFVSGVGLPGRVWSTGEPVWIPDVASDSDFPRIEAAARANLHAAVGLPVGDAAEPLGVLGFFATEVRSSDAAQLEAMVAAARQVGTFFARARFERRLAASEEISGSIFEAALDCIITMDADGRVLDFNPAAEATFGYHRGDTHGRRLAELIIPEEFRAAHERALRRYVETREPSILNQRLELVAVRSDGGLFPVELTVTRLGTQEPPIFAGFVRDITDRRRTEERIAELLERERRARLEAEAAERSSRRISEALQHSLLPPHLPTIPGMGLGAIYESVAAGSLVGGDFYDVFPVAQDRWGVVIGDVSGKGAEAASLTALVRYTLRTAAVRERSPRKVLCTVNDALVREPRENAYCTLIYGYLSLEGPLPVLRLAVAGHPLPLVIRADGATHTVGGRGTLLGAVDDPPFEDQEVVLAAGDTLLLYTDGVTETRTPRGLLGLEGLWGLVESCPERHPQALVNWIGAEVHAAPGHRVADDIAMLALRCGV